MICLYCGGTSSQELLEGNFLRANAAAIDLISPVDGSAIDPLTPFSWSGRIGVGAYILELSESSDFSSPIVLKTVSQTSSIISFGDTTTGGNIDAKRYYWRVKAKVQSGNDLTSKAFLVYLLDRNVVYVNVNSPATVEKGNKDAPFKVLQSAIDFAKLNSIPEVHAASGTYNEEINMKSGIAIRGGYSGSDWSRNISSNVSIISAPIDRAIIFSNIPTDALTTTIVDGFSIVATSSSYTNYGVYFSQSAGTVSNNSLNIRSSAGSSSAIGVYANNSTVSLLQNTFNIYTAAQAANGIQGQKSNFTIRKNKIFISALPTGTAQAYGINTFGTTGSDDWIISANHLTITAPSSGATGIGMSFAPTSRATISNNTIQIFGDAGNRGVLMQKDQFILANNIMQLIGTNTNRAAVDEKTATSNPASLQGNYFTDSYRIYVDYFAIVLQDQLCATDIIDFGTAAVCSGGAITSPSMYAGGVLGPNYAMPTGQTQIDIYANPLKYRDITSDGPDAGSGYDGTTTRIEIAVFAGACGQYVANEYLEYDNDGVPRQIQTVNCSASTSYIDLYAASALPSASVSGKSIKLWGTNNTNLVEDYSPRNGSRIKDGGIDTGSNSCGIGGSASCGSVTEDLNGNTLTAPYPIGAYR